MKVETVDPAAVTPSATIEDRLATVQWLAQRMQRQPDQDATLRAVIRQAVSADLGDAVGVLMVRSRRITVGAASDLDVRRVETLQLDTSEGPGVEAILTRGSFIADDLRLDSRWRFWGPRAAAVGWLSSMTVCLADGDTFGSLTLYSRQVCSFSPADLVVAETFAEHAAHALARTERGRSWTC
jgi:GAF domain-containing protein